MKSIQIGGFLVIFTWKAKRPIFKAIVAGFRGKVAQKNRTLGVLGSYLWSIFLTMISQYIAIAVCVFFPLDIVRPLPWDMNTEYFSRLRELLQPLV